MSSRTHTWNGFETSLATQLLAGEFSFTVDAALGLEDPLYAVIDPDVPANREWIKIVSVVGNTINVDNPNGRGMAGSAGAVGTGTDHAVGAKMRMVFTKQLQDDIFDDIEALETAFGFLPTTYVRLDGTNQMTAPLLLRSAVPTLDDEATRKVYVDTAAAAAQTNAEAYADSLDHDHDAPILNHASDENAHHDKFTDADAVAATAGVYVPLNGSTPTLTIPDLSTQRIKATNPGNDLVFRDGNNSTIFYYDDSTQYLEVLRHMDLNNHTLFGVKDPTNATHVGDLGYNDVRYAPKSHSHSYLPLSGGTLTGTLTHRTLTPASDNAYNIGSSTRRVKDIFVSGRLMFSNNNNDHIRYDTVSNGEWKFESNGVIRTILGTDVSRFSGAMTLYQSMATFSSGGYATLRRRDSDGRILELSSHPDTKVDMRTPEAFTLRAKELVQRAKGYIYGDVDSPDEGELIGMNSLEVAEVFPEMTHMVDGVPRAINYDMLVTPILEVLRDYEARLAALEPA